MSYMSTAVLVQKIAHVKNMGVRMDSLIVDCANNALRYLNDPLIQNTTYTKDLVDAMPKSGRRETLKAWFMKHGKIKFTTGEEGKEIVSLLKRKDITPENWEAWCEKGEASPFFKSVEKPAKEQLVEMDAEEAFIKLLKRMVKADTLEHQELFGKVWEVMPDHVKAKVEA